MFVYTASTKALDIWEEEVLTAQETSGECGQEGSGMSTRTGAG